MKKRLLLVPFLLLIFLVFFQALNLFPGYFKPIEAEIFKSTKQYTVEYINKVKTIYIKGDSDKPLIIYYHGNYELIDHNVDYLNMISKERGYSFLLVEYNGYGDSEGFPSLYETTETTYNYIINLYKDDIKDKEIIVWGRSLGSGFTFHFAQRFPEYIDKIIIQSGFVSPLNAFTNNGTIIKILTPLILWDFDSRWKIKSIAKNNDKIKALILHGKEDEFFHIETVRSMENIFKENSIDHKTNLFEGSHNSINYNKNILYNFIEY